MSHLLCSASDSDSGGEGDETNNASEQPKHHMLISASSSSEGEDNRRALSRAVGAKQLPHAERNERTRVKRKRAGSNSARQDDDASDETDVRGSIPRRKRPQPKRNQTQNAKTRHAKSKSTLAVNSKKPSLPTSSGGSSGRPNRGVCFATLEALIQARDVIGLREAVTAHRVPFFHNLEGEKYQLISVLLAQQSVELLEALFPSPAHATSDLLYCFMGQVNLNPDPSPERTEFLVNTVKWWTERLGKGVDEVGEAALFGTPLCFACWWRDTQLVRILIEKGADVNHVSPNTTPLISALTFWGLKNMAGLLETLQILLDAGADPTIANAAGYTCPILRACAFEGVPGSVASKALKLLLEAGATPNNVFSSEGKQTPLMLAVTPRTDGKDTCSLELTRQLLHGQEGVAVNATSAGGKTALHFAVERKRATAAEVVQLLLDYGADPNATNKRGFTPLDVAKQKKVADAIELLSGVTIAAENSAFKVNIIEGLSLDETHILLSGNFALPQWQLKLRIEAHGGRVTKNPAVATHIIKGRYANDFPEQQQQAQQTEKWLMDVLNGKQKL